MSVPVSPQTTLNPVRTPLSMAQQSLWFLHRLVPSSTAAFNVRAIIRIRGPLQPIVLEQAMKLVVARHETLRVRILASDAQAVQEVSPDARCPVATRDLSALDPARRETALSECIDDDGRQAFDLSQAPLFRCRLLRLAEDDWYLLLTAHHLIADAWSAGRLLHELGAFYRTLTNGSHDALPPLAWQYSDYVAWQRQQLASESVASDLEFWKATLAGVEPLRLPADFAPAEQTHCGASFAFTIGARETEALRTLARAEGGTLFHALLGVYAVLLHRLTGQTDFTIGTSNAGRTFGELEPLIGFFADLVVLRQDLSGAPTFRQFLARIRRDSLAALDHQSAPFDLILREISPGRVGGANPLFQAMFLYTKNEVARQFEVPGLSVEAVQFPSVTSKYPLSLQIEEHGNRLQGLVEYRTDLFEPETIGRWVSYLLNVVASIAVDCDRPVDDLPMLDPREERLLTVGRNQRAVIRPREATLHGWFERQVDVNGNRIALSGQGQTMTYRDLDSRANRLAYALRRLGVGPETRVGLCMGRTAEAIVAIVAILKAGGAYVPLDPAYPPARLRFLVEDSGLALIVADQEALDTAAFLPDNVRLFLPALETEALAQSGDEAPSSGCSGANAAYIIYTSGSTGKPKGVVVTHDNVTRLFAATEDWFQFGSDDVWTLFHSLAFDFSVWEIWGALLYGGRLVVVPYLTTRSPEAFYQVLSNEQITVLNQTPSAFRQLMEVERKAPATELALRYVIFGGEALTPTVLAPWVDRYSDERPQLINMYGITETTVHVTFKRLRLADIERARSVVGERIPDLEVYVLDPAMRPVPKGVTGELFVGGAGLSRGYLERPDLTADRFVPNPFSTEQGARLYRTGDRARWLSGDLEYVGRSDTQVKIRGFRVEPQEIEEVLRQHAEVRDALVLLDGTADEGKKLVGYIVPKGARQPKPAQLHDWCRASLPGHMVPAVFVAVPEWPLTAHGKVDRGALPAAGDTAIARRGGETPRNELERILAGIWTEVLGTARIGIDDKFFELGGDSILMLRVLAAMRRRNLACSLADLYRCQCIRELAAHVQASSESRAQVEPFSLVAIEDRARLPERLADAYPITRLQMGMLFHRELSPESAVYHDVFSFHVRLHWNPAAFDAALRQVVESHPALRTGFDISTFSEPLQMVRTSTPIRCTFSDVADRTIDDQRRAVADAVASEKCQGFDPSAPPLMRFHLLRRSQGSMQIVFSFHHAIMDGWSVASMMTALLGNYLARLDGVTPAAALQPGPAAAIARERQSIAEGSDAPFWLARSFPVVELPREREASRGARRIERFSVPISAETSSGLHAVAVSAGTHVKSVVLAAHLLAIGRFSGARRAVSGVVMNTRPESGGSERMLGLFVNTLPIALELDAARFVDLVKAVDAEERAILAHRHFPMHEIRRLQGGRALFDAAFNFVHFHIYRELLESSGIDVLANEVWEETDFPFLAQFSMFPGSSQLELLLIYDAAQFSLAQVERFAGGYRRILASAVHQPGLAPMDIELCSEAEAAQVLAWSGEVAQHPVAGTLADAFSRRAAAQPAAVALRFEETDWSYADLDAAATALAHVLRARGVGRQTLVGLALDRTPWLIVGMLGVLKAGGAYVPLDPAYPAARLAFMVADSGVRLVLTADPATLPPLPGATLLDVRTLPSGETAGPLPTDLSADDPAYVIYTSGSTGQPKGVVVPHGHVLRLLAAGAAHFAFGPADVWTLFHSAAFDFSVWEVWGALLAGGRLVIVPYDVSRTPARFHALLAAEQVTVLNQTPSAFRQLVAAEPPEAPPLALRYVIFGGEALDLRVLAPWVARHGDAAPHLVNMYGITETTVHVTYRRLTEADVAQPPGSVIGRPLDDLAVYVLDARQALVPVGVPGELYVGGAGVTPGYLGHPALTAARFVPNPFGPGRLYRTGDGARWRPTGELEYLGRLDAQVKLRGFRIEPGEIEAVLRERGGVADVLVVARPHVSGEPQLVAYLCGAAPAPAVLRDVCRQWLPAHMVPAAFVPLAAWPLTPNGKLDRAALPTPDLEPQAVQPFMAPRTEDERRLCAIWEDVLGVKPIGIRHGFFDVGGHSLLATRLVSKIRAAFGVDLPLLALFDAPTVEQMNVVIAGRLAGRPTFAGIPISRAPRQSRHIVVGSDGELLRTDQDPVGT